MGYVLATFVDYKLVPLICVTIPILFAMVFITLPNTTQYYLARRQLQVLPLRKFNACVYKLRINGPYVLGVFFLLQNAEYAFKFYKGYTGLSQYEQSAFYIEFERLKLIASKRKEEKKVQLADFCKFQQCSF